MKTKHVLQLIGIGIGGPVLFCAVLTAVMAAVPKSLLQPSDVQRAQQQSQYASWPVMTVNKETDIPTDDDDARGALYFVAMSFTDPQDAHRIVDVIGCEKKNSECRRLKVGGHYHWRVLDSGDPKAIYSTRYGTTVQVITSQGIIPFFMVDLHKYAGVGTWAMQ